MTVHSSEQQQAAAALLLNQLSGWAASVLLGVGLRTGLLDAVLIGPGTAEQIAERAGTSVPSTREWLAAVVAAGHLIHRAGTFTARRGLAAALDSPDLPVDLRAFLELPLAAPQLHGELLRAVREGGGIGYPTLHEVFGPLSERLEQRLLRTHLVKEWIPAVPGLSERLADGAEVLDIGCGSGEAVLLLAERYPASRFLGVDLDTAALDRARNRVGGLGNVEFRTARVPPLPPSCAPQVVLLINVLHDLPLPQHALSLIAGALPTGAVVMAVESAATGDPGVDAQRPNAVLGYFSSLTHCVQVSLAEGGDGPGALWGVHRVLAAFDGAGLNSVARYDSPVGRCVISGVRG